MQLTARDISAQELFDLLAERNARKIDVVLPAVNLTAEDGRVQISGIEPALSEYGVTPVDGLYLPLDTFHEHLSAKLGIPLTYLRRMAEERPDLWDENVNGWLHGYMDGGANVVAEPDPRAFLFRGYRGTEVEAGRVARGLLSDSYKLVDDIDVATATLDGIRQAGADVVVSGADITDRRMFIRFVAPTVAVAVDALMEHYRDPFADGTEKRAGNGGWSEDMQRAVRAAGYSYGPGQAPVLWAGFEVSNSELGMGATTITPRGYIQVCRNGQKIAADVLRSVHLGGKLDTGVIDWSQDTQRKALELITAKTRDAVAAFLSPEYWEVKVAELTAKAGKPVRNPDDTIKVVAKTLGYSEDERATILRHFILGGQVTAGGVMNAITSAAQTVTNADRAAAMEDTAVKALDLV